MQRLLEIKELTVHFYTDNGTIEAIDQANIGISRGEVVGLIGESGCGKTTTARAVLGIIPSPPGRIVHGEIGFQGQDLLKMDRRQFNKLIRGKAITLIPQDPFNSLNPLFTIGTQIMDIMRWKFKPREDHGETAEKNTWVLSRRQKQDYRDKIIHMLKQMQIPSPEQQLRKHPHELSGGQRQRVLIAMALLSGPSLIIADEPTTALDVTIEAQILRLFRQLVKEYGVSVLYITHDLGVASQICDRVFIMYAGQVMESAPTSSFFRSPLHPYTRKLLESLPKPSGEISDIPGEVPNLINPGPGCRFFSRCDLADPKCKKRKPQAEELLPNHWVACFHPVKGGNTPISMTDFLE